jgi:tRNA-specific 2-thiouridylase
MRAWSSACVPKPTRRAKSSILRGRVLGRHPGVVHFTVGQRRGLEIGGHAEPLYVVRIEPESRRLVVGPKSALAVAEARVQEWNGWAKTRRKWRSRSAP